MASVVPRFQRLVLRGLLQGPSRLFVCSQCLGQAPRRPPSTVLDVVRSRGYASASPTAPPLVSLAKLPAAMPRAQEAIKKAFPQTTSKGVAYWLLGSAASVFGIVVFGGLTRLTESGFKLSRDDWESEFDKYRASPEFKLLNPHMTLDEFKKIYFMEWAHRLWGRFIGLSFVLPSLYFIARRRVTPRMAVNLVGISALIGFQGIIGWWMVKSGLKDDLFAPGSHPRVSQYRLTTHLATAFACYSWMLLSGLAVLRTHRMLADPKAALSAIRATRSPALATFRLCAAGLAALVFVTVMSGGLVAGLDAGLIYNEFPKMGLGLTPPRSELWDAFYSRKEDGSDLWWRNMLENPSTVQMDHRILAVTTFCAILALFAYSRTGRVAAALPPSAKKSATSLVHLVSLQVALGISTLIYLVPVPLAAAHQAGSLAVLTGALVLAHRMHVPRPTVRMIEQRLKRMQR
ncbi:Heme A synthase/Protoheme IX farnesyltransferase [Ophiocordyceps sinensis CO18]|uniref:Heme A synthase/Protoheme IX farnesyltransferase n=1 Tax=Ophiocordyceps sinensis (strain Co18 / CGMCC 3.14243) TaxID=911162 RepID=T5AQK6_OPHSC|nr:Heme A synthase/Protoheme IX farnesyltransferase [Ophiocordyceps sinensis CO18]